MGCRSVRQGVTLAAAEEPRERHEGKGPRATGGAAEGVRPQAQGLPAEDPEPLPVPAAHERAGGDQQQDQSDQADGIGFRDGAYFFLKIRAAFPGIGRRTKKTLYAVA